MMKEPTIDQYLIADCLCIIDEFNIMYRDYSLERLKTEADENFNEMDITVRIGYPFKQTAHYTAGDLFFVCFFIIYTSTKNKS